MTFVMVTLPHCPTLVNLSLPFAAQQAQILGLTAGVRVSETERLQGADLMLRYQEKTGFAGAPMCPELEAAEDHLVEHLGGAIPQGSGAKVLLTGPGMSKTDPLYALRFLAKISMKTERAGELTVYDLNNNPDILRYYDGLPWGTHRVNMELGPGGNFENLRGKDAHMILAIHPGIPLDFVFGAFAKNLVKGGIGLYQGGIDESLIDDEDPYAFFLDMMMGPYKHALEFAEPPSRSRLFRSFFSERSGNVHALMVRRK